MQSYTYFLKNNKTGQFYYGSRGTKYHKDRTPEEDLWKYYFSSSKYVKKLIAQLGATSFDVKILLKSDYYIECYNLEQVLIKEHIKDPLCLNRQYFDVEKHKKVFSPYGRTVSTESRTKMSVSRFDTTISEETREKQSSIRKGRKLTISKKSKASCSLRSYAEISGEEAANLRKKKLSDKAKIQHLKNPRFGKKNSNAKKYSLISPDGVEHIVEGALESFCSDHKLNTGLVIATAKGRRPSYRGWIIKYVL